MNWLLLLILSKLMAGVSAALEVKLVRKRDSDLSTVLGLKMNSVEFGRALEEPFLFSSSLSYSFSYSFSYNTGPGASYDYSFSYSFSQETTPTPRPSSLPTPLDLNSNDGVVFTKSPTASPSLASLQPSSKPTAKATDQETKPDPNSSTANGSNVDNVQTKSSPAYVIPVIGVVTGACIVGLAVYAIDRRSGPVSYHNLDGDSASSFSMP